MVCEEKDMPFGFVDEDDGQLDLAFGRSAKTIILQWTPCTTGGNVSPWTNAKNSPNSSSIKTDNEPESSSQRVQFLKRIVEFEKPTGKPIQLLCSTCRTIAITTR